MLHSPQEPKGYSYQDGVEVYKNIDTLCEAFLVDSSNAPRTINILRASFPGGDEILYEGEYSILGQPVHKSN